ncbi:nuclear pore complex protein DDB_G0274915-like [Physella acuta]|uniref:nuclear pore complex protein DDB_G0274915-like n=1 Tax=Physella acuta TaxID=109671 RepID=UPI0027DD002C|nr:nuclear pore complex protein DDB_G0274915-like [Physella acuta]
MSACEHFTQNAWRPDLCSTCQRAKSEHEGVAGSRSSWRRRSEPNPNNAITGVRISALASKFQGRETRSGSIPEDEHERARTLDRKYVKAKSGEKKLNVSRSTDLLDAAASSTLSVSERLSSSSTSAITSTQSKPSFNSSKNPESNHGVHTTTPVATCSASSVSSSSKPPTDASAHKSITTQPLTTTKTRTTVLTNNQKPSTKSSTQRSAKDSPSSTAPPATGTTTSAVKVSTVTRQTLSNGAGVSATSAVKSAKQDPASVQTSSVLKTSKLVEQGRKNDKSSKSKTRRVSIPDSEPEVIGTDGGLDNLFPEEEVVHSGEDTDNAYLSLTDEEKQFALLALGNTVWNSDTRNLQVEPENAKRACREFEDLEIDQLLTKERFKTLVDCDAVKHRTDFGTFPQISGTKQTKLSIESVKFNSDSCRSIETVAEVSKCIRKVEKSCDVLNKKRGTVSSTPDSNGQSKSSGHSSVERLKSAGSSGTSGNSSMTSLSSDSDWKGNYGSSSGSGDSGVEMGPGIGDKERPLSYTVGDITDCLYETPDEVGTKTGDTSAYPHAKSRSSSSTERKTASNSSTAKLNQQNDSMISSMGFSLEAEDVRNLELLNDSTTMEGLQAIALLNDVLKDYSDFNESSTDDYDGKKDPLKGKKSSDFEARMASVAANLDLTKQQRAKRQAPRPPVSPPPEPTSAQAISPKKVANQPDPVFKMVPVGKSIVTIPPQQDIPKSTKTPQGPVGVEEYIAASDNGESLANRMNGDGKGKKGITSFFRNILRRGKDSSESFESLNPDVQLIAKLERKDSTGTPVSSSSLDIADEDVTSSSVDKKPGPKLSQPSKVLVIPPSSVSPQHKGGTTPVSGDGSQTIPKDPETISTTASISSAAASNATTPVSASPPTQRKKGLASPKMMLKKATAKFSPPVSRHQTKPIEKDLTDSTLPKPYPAPKPAVPPPSKPPVTSTSTPASTAAPVPTSKETSPSNTKERETTAAPNVVKRRPKSPKRTAPPVPPSRTSVGQGKSAPAPDSRNTDLARELEWRLNKAATDQSGCGTLTRESRRSMPVPPSPPGERKEKTSTGQSPPISPIHETENSLPSSPSSPAGTSFDFVNTEWSGGSTSTIDDDLPKFTEKIELPTVANPGRKGFLGKLGGNRKNRAPQPPSVKRAKSITESSTLPRGDKKSKKINVADISGPVLVTDITNSRVLENRRNTISLGDEPAFHTVNIPTGKEGPTNSTASVDKGGFDEFDFPVLSPLGSLENLYESILPKPEGNMFHYYDPPTSPKVLCPNIPSDGYLEPVPPLTLTSVPGSLPAASAGLSTAALISGLTQVAPSSSNSSSAKSPLKTKGAPSKFVSRESVSSGSGHTTSTSSSEANSTENSGNSLPDSTQLSKLPSQNGLGSNFVEPEMTEQRRLLLASQPIYEEIPNGNNEDDDLEEAAKTELRDSQKKKKMSGAKESPALSRKPSHVEGSTPGLSRKPSMAEGTTNLQKIMLPGLAPGGELTKSQIAHAWLQQPHTPVPQIPNVPPPASSSSSSASSSLTASVVGALPTSPSHVTSKHNLAPTSLHLTSMTSSMLSVSSLMTTSMTSSMLPPPPPPPDHLPAPPPTASRSVSKETVSSESDTQSNCSTLSRPRPAPRRKPKRPDTGGSDQYVSMNRPNAQVSLSEEKLRDVFTKVTSITFHALQDIYAQCERILFVDRLDIPNPHVLKWPDFDIYGQPLHASGRCIVYNAKFRANSSPCQVMILHSRPATERCTTSHPSLLRPSAVFADTIPFSYLTPDFIKTSQLLQNSVYDSSQARCFIAVGAFDVVESLDSHLALLRETLALDPTAYLNIILTAALQLLSAMSHCLDQGFSVTETDYNDVFLITRSDLRGKVVAFLPHQRSLDVPQGEAMCNFLDRLFLDAMPQMDEDEDDMDEDDDEEEEYGEKIISAPRKVVARLRSMLESRRVECLGQVRASVEYLLWGPATSELPLSPHGTAQKSAAGAATTAVSSASREQELYVWLEKERVSTIGRLARNVSGLGAGLTLEEFYTLKFLLKSSAGCLAESLRRLSR